MTIYSNFRVRGIVICLNNKIDRMATLKKNKRKIKDN